MTSMRSRSLAATALALVSFVPLASTMGCNKPAGNAPAASAAAAPAEKKLPGAETPEALVERMKAGAPLAKLREDLLYTAGAEGYSDYPPLGS